MIIDEENYLQHYGILRRSGRYPWGSSGWGKGDDNPAFPWSGAPTVAQRSKGFLDYVQEMRNKGLSDKEIAAGVGMSEKELRSTRTNAKNEFKASQIAQVQRLKDKGTSIAEISRRMEMPEPTVRSYLKPGADDRIQNLRAIRDIVKKAVDEKRYVDIGSGVETQLGVSREKLEAAIVALKDLGYVTNVVPQPQLTGKHNTDVMVMSPKGVSQHEAFTHRLEIQQINDYSKDGGRTFLGIYEPLSISSKRVQIAWDEDGGSKNDGVVYVREGVEDISLGGNRYGQVRILIDGTHFIKGMAIYKDDMPPGVDLVFNTNKSREKIKSEKGKVSVIDALKEVKRDEETGEIDPDNPFGTMISRQITKNVNGEEKLTSAMNIVNNEGDWVKWRDSLAPQMLSKQSPKLAQKQLDVLYEKQKEEFDEIKNLTNPLVKKKLLQTFSDATDSKAVDMKAAKLPRQSWQVILPVDSLKDNEVYAPNYKNGERVALVRYPHGGTFEIPDLVVNNNNREGKKLLGPEVRDAIGINHKVANRLSGADFDGDTVLVIPNDKGSIKISPALEGLKDFDPIRSYPKYEGMTKITKSYQQRMMGEVSNLITDMTLRGASSDKIARAVRHSMVVIDAEKHELNWKESERANGIQALKAEFQREYSPSGSGGAGTLISRAGAEVRGEKLKLRLQPDGGPIDPKTGKLVWVPSGETYKGKDGERVPKTEKRARLARTDDAFELIEGTGTRMERIYATHANRMKDLANAARLEFLKTPVPKVKASPATKQAYAPEIASLDAKLAAIKMNRPKERHAQAIATAQYAAKKRANPSMDKQTQIKIKTQAVMEARERVGLPRRQFEIEPKEWEAIQAGAISNSKLSQILDKADMEQVKQYATPRKEYLMTATKTDRAQQMLSSGYTREEVAQHLGVSISTLDRALYDE